mmetsp:Transcript_32516/g.69684  ORF Transcript_32516/g.69684 Transcript_32516/m.69684 type:complete len:417 (+) Transcript_32516:2098-3348(+)
MSRSVATLVVETVWRGSAPVAKMMFFEVIRRGAAAAAAADSQEAREKEVAERMLLQARMYLRTVLNLTKPVLTENKEAAANSEAGAEPAASSSSRPGKSSSSAAAAPANANNTGNQARNASPFPHGFRGQARALAEYEANLLEDAACVKLAYVCLCQSDFHSALIYSKKVLTKNGLPDGGGDESEDPSEIFTVPEANTIHERSWTSAPGTLILAALYASEALLMLGSSNEARALLGHFIALEVPKKGSELFRNSSIDSHVVGFGTPCRTDAVGYLSKDQEAVARETLGAAPTSTMGGLTPPSYVIQNLGTVGNVMAAGAVDSGNDDKKDKGSSLQVALMAYPPTHFPNLASASAQLYANMAVLQAQESKLDLAMQTCQKAMKLEPKGLAQVRTMAYILLRKGDRQGALRILKQSRS